MRSLSSPGATVESTKIVASQKRSNATIPATTGSQSLLSNGARRSSVRKVAALTRDCRAANPAERKRVASSCVKSMIASSASQPALRDTIFAFAEVDYRPSPGYAKSENSREVLCNPREIVAPPAHVKCGFFREPSSDSTVTAPCFSCGRSVLLSESGWLCLPSSPNPWSPLCPACHQIFHASSS